MKRQFIISSILVILIIVVLQFVWKPILWSLVIVIPLFLIGLNDMLQKKHAIRRNFPLIGNFRYLLEGIGPEINQYFIESNSSGVPFSRQQRSLVYQRAKNTLDTLPFGTQMNVSEVGYEWVNHSLNPIKVDPETMRVTIGGSDCLKPYDASILNISAMSYGALSKNAVLALNQGAKNSGFAQNTGEGGLTEHHLKNGGDLIWQIGTGYFGARTLEGKFDPDLFKEKSSHANVKMIEVKLSQGAKPGHGGILPAAKVTKEISEIRNVPLGKDVNSPPAHSTFSTPMELLEFVKQLRDLSGGKPIGFKLCVGKRREFLAICKAMVETNILPDYIAVDGGEGGTGSAPLEFSNSIGAPLTEALIFVHNALTGFNLRSKLRVICSGKIISGFDIVKNMAVGADLCYSARAMMLAVGCIQSLKCNANTCPTGVATQDPHYMQALNVEDKAKRTSTFHDSTVESVAEIIGAMGLESTSELKPWHRVRRTDFTEIKNYSELFQYIEPGSLLQEPIPEKWARAVKSASSTSFKNS
ncbi:FMN-binding glutamate synthase family protein [uncultured Aquimarina sp.]|uniref:FMN-binding glutamate synthase family protein n=1 Tax=uncultured Aquimarina sp. TaxID=575652 RepID=UPI0026075641|nr:FMN-binding glutamate synthase family protein [uncultured Aquimarina sp.]